MHWNNNNNNNNNNLLVNTISDKAGLIVDLYHTFKSHWNQAFSNHSMKQKMREQ